MALLYKGEIMHYHSIYVFRHFMNFGRMTRPTLKESLLVVGVLVAFALQGSLWSERADAAEVCTKYAAVGGSDSATGAKDAPFQTAQKLADSLAPGEVGCFRSGVFVESDTLLRIADPGITLQSMPGERASIKARVYVPEGADGITVRDLDLDGSPNSVPGPTINANNTSWINNTVTNQHKSKSCFVIGSTGYGIASGTLIQNNRIHDCGSVPGTSEYPHGHGIYVNAARDTKILDNKIYDNTDRGIQLRVDAQRTTIRRNVIDGNGTGLIFSGDYGTASNGTLVENNIISFPKNTFTVHSFYPKGNPVGQNNLVRKNCVFNGKGSGVQSPTVGFSASGNVMKDPRFVNRTGKDFRLRSDSPCRTILAG